MHTTIHIHIQNMHQVFGSRLVASRYARRKKNMVDWASQQRADAAVTFLKITILRACVKTGCVFSGMTSGDHGMA